MGEKNVYMRTSEDTRRLVRIFAGEIQMETGKSVSDNDALAELFKRYRPDLMDRLEDIKKVYPTDEDETDTKH